MSKKYKCPFCGQKEAVTYKAYITLAGKDVEGYAVYCESCGARGPNCPLKRQAVEKWNYLVRTLEFYSIITEE